MTHILEMEDGRLLQFDLSPNASLPTEGVVRVAETPRLGRHFEHWNWATGSWEVTDLEVCREDAIHQIDATRDELCRKAPVSPRSEEYAEKLREARDPEGPWPYLAAEAASRGVSISAVRKAVKTKHAEAVAADPKPQIAAVAVAAKALIRDAGDAAAVRTILGSIDWPSAGATS